MGEEATRKVTEIQQTRSRLEGDIKELEDRIPAPLRSVKGLVGGLVGSAGGMLLLKKLISRKRSSDKNTTEVVVRVVRDDVSAERERR